MNIDQFQYMIIILDRCWSVPIYADRQTCSLIHVYIWIDLDPNWSISKQLPSSQMHEHWLSFTSITLDRRWCISIYADHRTCLLMHICLTWSRSEMIYIKTASIVTNTCRSIFIHNDDFRSTLIYINLCWSSNMVIDAYLSELISIRIDLHQNSFHRHKYMSIDCHLHRSLSIEIDLYQSMLTVKHVYWCISI